MASQNLPNASYTINAATDVGELSLTVSNLQRSIDFYRDLIGLRVIDRHDDRAVLGVGAHSILHLVENSGANAWPRGGRSFTGLYHFALLLPTRADLGRWLDHWLRTGMPQPGQGDHYVSEALYLEDPDGHGIEIYRDRPRDEWEWSGGQVRMGVEPVDIRGLLDRANEKNQPWTGMPDGTTLGHIHLQVADIGDTTWFYRDVLGFDIVAQMPSALFISAGGYHHHIGANIWHSRSAETPPDDVASLQYFTIDLPATDALDELVGRFDEANVQYARSNNEIVTHDPAGIEIHLRVDPSASSI